MSYIPFKLNGTPSLIVQYAIIYIYIFLDFKRENQPPTLGQSATDSGKICQRFWENQPPTLQQSATDSGKICQRF